ncbi:MAG: hypothetical protein ABFC98_06435 [Candidatus Cloacimonas sp.]
MKRVLILISILVCAFCQVEAVSIYQVQFTSFRGSDGTFPSLYTGKSVALEGIVTATDYQQGGYFISERLNGPWRGILVLDRNAKVKKGDYIKVLGTVSEFYGMTCLQDIAQTRIISGGNALPQPILLTTGQLSHSEEAESYEGVYIRFLNVSSTSNKGLKNSLEVTDGSGTCFVIGNQFNTGIKGKMIANAQYASITGIVVYGFSQFALCPISSADFYILQPTFIQNRSWGKIKSIYK